MPYSIQTADDITIDGIPDDIKPDAPELKARVQAVRLERHSKTPEGKAEMQAQRIAQERDRLMKQTVDEIPWYLRGAVNIGAGYQNLVQGIDQVIGDPIRKRLGMAPVATDEDVREKRMRDAYLARGPVDKLNQFVGEVGPLAAMPSGAVALGYDAARAAPVVSRMLPALGRNTQALGAAATGGAATSALSPVTSEESRGLNSAVGAGLSAAFPVVGFGAPAMYRGARKMLTESGAEQRAAELVANQLGDAAPAVREALGDYAPLMIRGREVDIPTSAAQAVGDARLAQLEAYSRSQPRTQPDWANFDAATNAARYGVVQDMAPSDLRMERLQAVRQGRTAPMREKALSEAAMRPDIARPLLNHTDEMMAGATSANPAVRSLGNYVRRELGADAEAAVTPARMYELRKVLTSKLDGPTIPGDELSAAAKGAQRETRAMIAAIDDTLNQAASGSWSPYLREYVERSKPIAAGRVLQDIAEKIEAKPLRGTTPEVTAAGYGTALRQNSGGKFGDKLTPETRTDADAFLDRLKQAEAASRTRKTSATMGGGSITNTDQALANFTRKIIDALPGVGGYAERVSNYNREQVEMQLMRLMQSPTKLGAQLRTLSDSQRGQMVDEVLRASGTGAAQGATDWHE